MARTIEEIYNAIVEEKQSFAELSNLMPQYNLAPPVPGNPFADFIERSSIGEQSSYMEAVDLFDSYCYLYA